MIYYIYIKFAVIFLCLLFIPSVVLGSGEGPPHSFALEELGKVTFPITCSSNAQKQFKRALAMLHSFWYEEARRAFKGVIETEPECGMGYWGIAMTYYHPLWEPPNPEELREGLAAVGEAKKIGKMTEREWGYIISIETFFKKNTKLNHAARALAYSNEMKRLQKRYPQDREAEIFYALSLLGTVSPSDKGYKTQLRAGEILEKILEEQPGHPGVSHYLIHAYDYPELVPRAKKAAKIYAGIAPAVPHALHMPSHIFTRLGLWQESIQSNLASSSAVRNISGKKNPKTVSFEDLHALDYLMYAYLQGAEDHRADSVLSEIRTFDRIGSENFASAYALAAIPSRYALERKQWKEAALVSLRPGEFPWDRYPWTEAIVVFARAMGHAKTNAFEKARKEIYRLEKLREKAEKDNKDYWATQIEIQVLTASAWLAFAEGKKEEALEKMRKAADMESQTEKSPVTPGPLLPANELLGDLLLELNVPRMALTAFETSLKTSPNRFNGLYGAGKAAELAEELDKASEFYSKLVRNCQSSNSQRPELLEAREFLKKNKT